MRNHNFGIDILRVWMCFEVILMHFWRYTPSDGNEILNFMKVFRCFEQVAVPCFMFISFLLCAPLLNSSDSDNRQIHRRIFRIAVPVLLWSVVYFLVINLRALADGCEFPVTFTDLVLQILLGHVYNGPMWFLNVLLALTLTVAGINRTVPCRWRLFVYVVLTAGALVFCLTGLAYRWFGGLESEISYPLGRYFEMFPFAGIANILFLSGVKVPEGRLRLRYILILIALCCCAGISWFIGAPAGFGYGKPFQYLFTIPLVSLMLMIPFNRFATFMHRTFTPIAHYTLGMYCLQSLIGDEMNAFCSHMGWPENSFAGCVAVFIICFLLCRIIAWIPCRFTRQAVS